LNSRLKQLVRTFKNHSIDALLVSCDFNISYLTEFSASESWLLVTNKKAYYITDSRYILEVKKALKGIPVIQYTTSMIETLLQLVKKHKIKRLGFDQNEFSLARYNSFKSKKPKGLRLLQSYGLVEYLRESKEKKEIASIKKALKIHDQALRYIQRYIKPGYTELEVLLKLEQFVKKMGVGFSFDPIIASGVNSCFPHAKVTKRTIRNNEPVLLDMGIDVNGYKSDLTRMFFLGKITNLVKNVTNFVGEAQRLAIEKIKPGALISEVDLAARNYLKEKNLAKYFGHALGHGVGLDIHESPRISSNNTNILRAGMVITVEPAVYLPGKFGVRVEDMILVTKTGRVNLSDNIYESN